MPSDINFDATQVTPNSRPDPIPDNDYNLAVLKSEVKPTKAGTGKILNLEIVVLDGDYKGSRIFQKINVQNPSAEAQKIGQGELSALCHATGVLQLKNSAQLHNIPFRGRVRIEQDAGYDPKNVIKDYKPIDGAVAGNVGASPAAAAAPAAAANAPAWAKKSA